jgi:hypothetical protein
MHDQQIPFGVGVLLMHKTIQLEPHVALLVTDEFEDESAVNSFFSPLPAAPYTGSFDVHVVPVGNTAVSLDPVVRDVQAHIELRAKSGPGDPERGPECGVASPSRMPTLYMLNHVSDW